MERVKETKVIFRHKCSGYAVAPMETAPLSSQLLWFTQGKRSNLTGVRGIKFCPWCGVELPQTVEEAEKQVGASRL